MRLQVRILLLQCTGMSCHRCVWRGQEEKESLSFRAITQPACPQSGVFSLFRTESESDVVSRGPMTAAWEVLPSLPVSKDPSAPAREDILKSTFGRRGSSTLTSAMIVSRSHADVCRQSHQLKARGREERKVQPVECRLCFAEGIRQEVTSGSLANLSSPRSYRSCIHREVPLRSSRSVVFLDKSLSISLVDLEGRRASRPTLYTSTLSFRFGASSCRRFSTDNKPDKTNEGHRRPRAVLGAEHRSGPGSTAGHSGGLLIKQLGRKVTQIAPARCVNSKPAQRHGSTLGLLSFRGPSPSNTRAGRQKGNADEAAFPTRSNFTHRQHDFNTGPVDSRTWAKTQEQAEREEKLVTEAQDETCCSHPQLKVDSLDRALKILSLKEALELYRPDFISRSQSRVRRLEQRAKRRRALQDSDPDLMQGLGEDAGRQRRNCTTPDPLSDNLFKPRERSITGREMQRRSRRIYNKLPEVTKKKEEEKKRAVSQTNRLRVEVFKKRLLDQILQR